jgi:hypothetical protein
MTKKRNVQRDKQRSTKKNTQKTDDPNKTINTNKHIQAMIRITDIINTGGDISTLEG